jgi:hypothetical protein
MLTHKSNGSRILLVKISYYKPEIKLADKDVIWHQTCFYSNNPFHVGTVNPKGLSKDLPFEKTSEKCIFLPQMVQLKKWYYQKVLKSFPMNGPTTHVGRFFGQFPCPAVVTEVAISPQLKHSLASIRVVEY